MDYKLPTTVAEAVKALQDADSRGRIIAGGTDLLLDLESGKHSAEILIDVSRIPELTEIRQENQALMIGAAVTFTELGQSELVRKYAPSLAQASDRVGSLQIRNCATLAGNVVTAQPAADGAVALATLEPQFIIEGPGGRRTASMKDMYAGFGQSRVDSAQEIVTFIRIPCQKENEASEFVRLAMRKSLALPMLNASVKVSVNCGKFEWARIAMGPVGVGPTRAEKAEEWLIQKDVTAENIRKAAQMALENANPRSSPFRGSREYRLKTLPVIIEQALISAAGFRG